MFYPPKRTKPQLSWSNHSILTKGDLCVIAECRPPEARSHGLLARTPMPRMVVWYAEISRAVVKKLTRSMETRLCKSFLGWQNFCPTSKSCRGSPEISPSTEVRAILNKDLDELCREFCSLNKVTMSFREVLQSVLVCTGSSRLDLIVARCSNDGHAYIAMHPASPMELLNTLNMIFNSVPFCYPESNSQNGKMPNSRHIFL